MRGTSMAAARWRTIRVFLDDNGVDEVDWDIDNPTMLRCTCFQYSRNASKRCKHIVFLLREARDNGGNFQVRLDKEVPDNVVTETLQDAKAFRDMVIRYSTAVVL